MPFYRWLLLLAVVLHLCAAWFSEGYYKDDEYDQILGFVAVKAGEILAAEAAWSYNEHIRSTVQPFIGWLIWQSVSDGINTPFIMAFFTRLLSVVLALVAAVFFFRAYQNDIKNEIAQRWVLAAMLLCWVLLFFHARFSSEGWMASFLLLAFAALRVERFWAAGLMLGLAFAVRYQTGFILLPLAAYVLFILRPGWRNVALLVAGGGVVLVAEFFINWWFYGTPSLPWVNYLLFHIDATPKEESTNSAFIYWQKSGEFIPPIGYVLPLILMVFWWKFPRHPLTWATILYISFHLITENRQLRFMLPILPFMPFITALVWEKSIRHQARLRRSFSWLLQISAIINAPLLLFAAFYPAAPEVKLFHQCILPNMQQGETAYFLSGNGVGIRDDISLSFYFRDKPIAHVSSEKELAEKLQYGDNALYISSRLRNEKLRKSGLQFQRICSALPEWVLQYNFNNWTARASSYPVYRVSNP